MKKTIHELSLIAEEKYPNEIKCQLDYLSGYVNKANNFYHPMSESNAYASGKWYAILSEETEL